MANEEIEISELEFTEELAGDNLIPVESSTDTKATSLQILKNWLSSFFVGKTGNETIAGVKTHTSRIDVKGQVRPLLFQSPDIDLTTAPSSNKSMFIEFLDKNGTRIGVMGVGHYPSGTYRLYSQIGNVGSMGIGIDGNGKIYAEAPASDINNSIVTTVAKNKAKNGYYKLGNGLIIQWGQDVFEGSSTTITLPTAFTSTNYSISHCAIDESGTYCVGMLVESKTTTNFVAHGWNTSGRVRTTDFWIAIGY